MASEEVDAIITNCRFIVRINYPIIITKFGLNCALFANSLTTSKTLLQHPTTNTMSFMYHFPLSTAYIWIERILCIIAFVHNLIAFAVTFWRNRNQTELSKEHNLAAPLFKITTTTIFLHTLHVLVSLLTVFVEYYDSLIPCSYWYTTVFTVYYTSKFCIWYYGIVRCKVVFHDSPFLQYRAFTLNLISSLFALTAIGLATLLISTSHIYHLIVFSEDNHCCVFMPLFWITLIVIPFDSGMGITGYWLFYQRISILTVMVEKKANSKSLANRCLNKNGKTLTPQYESEAEESSYNKLLYILRKYAILNACTLLSTWIAAGFATFVASHMEFFALDTMINTWCILLYDARYDSVYSKIFGCISKSEWKYAKKDMDQTKNKLSVNKSNKLEIVDSASTQEESNKNRSHQGHDDVVNTV